MFGLGLIQGPTKDDCILGSEWTIRKLVTFVVRFDPYLMGAIALCECASGKGPTVLTFLFSLVIVPTIGTMSWYFGHW